MILHCIVPLIIILQHVSGVVDIIQQVLDRHSDKKQTEFNDGKSETICIMTRDNICLSTNIYYPDSTIKGPYSTVYQNTPYGKESIDGDHSMWNDLGFVYLTQDDRGRFQSNGTFAFWTKVGNDSLDTVQWIINQSWSDGGITTYGISADALGQYGDPFGVTQYLIYPNPAQFNVYNEILSHILLMQPSLGNSIGWHTIFQQGAYRQGLTHGWLDAINEASYIKIIEQNEIFGPYWYPMAGPFDNQWNYYEQAIVHFSGWYDIFSTPQILTMLHLNDSSINDRAKSQQILIIEAGGHCPNGEIIWPNSSYGSDLNNELRKTAYSAVFNASNENNLDHFDVHDYYPFNVLWYQLGPGTINSNGNFWVAAEAFPDYKDTDYYLGHNDKDMAHPNGTLSVSNNGINDGNDSYLYNPKDPLITWGGNNLIVQPCGPWNQNHNEYGRKDVLHFTSDELTEDLYLVGMIKVNLFVSSSAVDTDFTAKLIDVFPAEHGSKNMLVQDGIYRMRFRNANEIDPFTGYANQTAPAMKPDEVYNITVVIGYMSYIFNKGHQISLSISSSNYKRFSVNYNSGLLVADGDKNWQNATNSVFYGAKYPSKLTLPIVNDVQWIQERKVSL